MSKINDLKKETDCFLDILHDLYGLYYNSLCGFEANITQFNNLKQNG